VPPVPEAVEAPSHPWHGWLPAVFPVDARRVRVEDSDLATTLVDSGAELVDDRPDVEIGPVERLRGDATQAIVSLGMPLLAGKFRFLRAGKRLLASLQLRRRAGRARREVRRLGYAEALVIGWDLEHALRVPGHVASKRLRMVERVPMQAIVLGRQRQDAPTVLDASLAGARASAESTLRAKSPVVRAVGLIVVGEAEVLRVAMGPAGLQLDDQRRALEALRAAGPPPEVAERVPWPVAHGRAGLGSWSLETRVPGTATSAMPAGPLLADCVEFLVALHGAAAPAGGDGQSLARDAEIFETVSSSPRTRELRSLAERLERELADLPRGFGHGDFWGGNLLSDGERLVGVVDWAAAGPGRLPLLDLLHLHVSAKRWLTNSQLGPVLIEDFLPWARNGGGGGDDLREYCRRLGLELTTRELEALVVAYWLDHVAYELRTYSDRTRSSWVDANVTAVLDAVLSGGYGVAH
jgi:aminoglycoside phosphotransferase (APT) family kinase protein